MANFFTRRFSNMNMAGGNHQAQNVQGILQEGQKSYVKTMDNKLGTQNAPNPFTKRFSSIEQPKPAPPSPKMTGPKK
jgi:hypothetical protein